MGAPYIYDISRLRVKKSTNISVTFLPLTSIYRQYDFLEGHAVAQLVEALLYKPEDRGFGSPIVSLDFFIDIILPAALCLWG